MPVKSWGSTLKNGWKGILPYPPASLLERYLEKDDDDEEEKEVLAQGN